ncbi:unnamed protein product, partial [Phaeothamnion confervicola]
RQGKKQSIGFLSNISLQKGVDVFLDLCQHLEERGWDGVAYIAGPFQDNEIKEYVFARLRNLNSICYLGPVYNELKNAFFEKIDIFIFPSSYSNEAEPLVVIEALANSIPVISTARGCLMEMIANGAGVIIPKREEFAARAAEVILSWRNDEEAFEIARQLAYVRYSEMH